MPCTTESPSREGEIGNSEHSWGSASGCEFRFSRSMPCTTEKAQVEKVRLVTQNIPGKVPGEVVK